MRKKGITIVSLDAIEDCIYETRGCKVMLDSDLAKLYEVPTKVFNQAVRRNLERFPKDFMFQMTWKEYRSLRSQFVTLKKRPGHHRKYSPRAFTEQGVAMLSGILNSRRAAEVNIAIMRVFVKMRRLLLANYDLAKKLEELENKLIAHDYQIEDILKVIRKLMKEPRKRKPKIGYLS